MRIQCIRTMKHILLLSIVLLSACSSVKNTVPGSDSISSYARSLIGIHYQYGGNSPDSGFDCSGFVDHVYRHTVGIKLPRSSSAISRYGKKIGRDELRAGDLVFFNTLRSKFSHVGIYLGDDYFIHAPSSGGKVRTENMRDAYWKQHYDGARRVI